VLAPHESEHGQDGEAALELEGQSERAGPFALTQVGVLVIGVASMEHIYGIISLVLIGGIWLVIFIMQKSLPAYLVEKGKNLATKEDIERLTKLTESIRSQFSHINKVHGVQFDAEFEAYKILWKATSFSVIHYIRWRSWIYAAEKGYEEFVHAQIAFSEALLQHRLFIPEDVWRTFQVLDDLLVDAKANPNASRSKEEVKDCRNAIQDAAGACEKAIRDRLSRVLVVSATS